MNENRWLRLRPPEIPDDVLRAALIALAGPLVLVGFDLADGTYIRAMRAGTYFLVWLANTLSNLVIWRILGGIRGGSGNGK